MRIISDVNVQSAIAKSCDLIDLDYARESLLLYIYFSCSSLSAYITFKFHIMKSDTKWIVDLEARAGWSMVYPQSSRLHGTKKFANSCRTTSDDAQRRNPTSLQTEKEGESWGNEETKDRNGEIESESRDSWFVNLKSASDSQFGQSHAMVIPRHIQGQRVKQDWSFSSYRGKDTGYWIHLDGWCVSLIPKSLWRSIRIWYNDIKK